MDAELKAKWVAALRSGEYRQGAGQLYSETRGAYCCLGVLCKVADLPINDEGDGVLYSGKDVGYAPLTNLIFGDKPEGGDGLSDFWSRNDGRFGIHKHTFAELADYIEANIPASTNTEGGRD